ncbi:hypothetical protein LCGC14_0124280 [marine sediment metagenome]|uniref:Glycosyl-hydrolase family 116 catalytic region domain-containing protein n=1 Tax=marine sediment metagenome TaxID=412755 RepID=A0A0F9Y7P4_9ZZZZ|nr:hypothetical protein [Phycisphaerae bacterium]HDZ42328.1 hypothetical protein [Phycisphaerae bacterium]
MAKRLNPDWPVLTSYDQDHLTRIALPLGGIGTGTVSLGGRGDLRDWEIMNRPAKGYAPRDSFFALFAKEPGKAPVTFGLEGLLEPQDYEGFLGSNAQNHYLPRFRNCEFHAAYPFGQVLLSDPDMPVDVRLEGFNPFIPADTDASSIPVAVLRFVVRNKTHRPIQAAIAGTVQNTIGTDGTNGKVGENVNTFKDANGLRGIYMTSREVPAQSECFGTMALATPAKTGVSHRTAWLDRWWGHAVMDFFDDFSADGKLTHRKRSPNVSGPRGSLAVKGTIPAKGEKTFTFLLTWHFPNRIAWPGDPYGPKHTCCDPPNDQIGNYYTKQYRNAWDVAAKTLAELPKLEAKTLTFVKSFCDSDLPDVVKEAALYNASTLRTQTCFRLSDGKLYAWEGCFDKSGCCNGTCTHVWNYEQATAYLFGDLSLTMREVEFIDATRADGHMDFRPGHLLAEPGCYNWAATDGQMGCIMKLYRDWQLSGDEAVLRRYWPAAKKALEFCWIPKGWDGDQDGVMEGAQHHTLDTEYFGPNPLCEGWYLGALRACEEMARYLGEDDFADKCRSLFERGREWTDENLFNGEYYEQQIVPPGKASNVAKGLLASADIDLKEPWFQLASGCLVDQLAGQFMAHVCGLGYLFKPSHIRKTLRSIFKYNRRENMFGHLNYRNSFVLNDESAMLIAVYPKGDRPKIPVPGQADVMTGFEYAAAVHMLQEGLTKQGLTCIKDIRDRYDGKKRSPFNEAECGHHYGRAMASWAAVTTLTGFQYSGVTKTMAFTATDTPSTFFWSNGYAWGTIKQRPTRSGTRVELKVLFGQLELKTLELTGKGAIEFSRPRRLTAGRGKDLVCKV